MPDFTHRLTNVSLILSLQIENIKKSMPALLEAYRQADIHHLCQISISEKRLELLKESIEAIESELNALHDIVRDMRAQ
jgi:hypothetical protein